MPAYEQDPNEETGIKDLTPRGSTEVTRARERKANAALELALAGYDWTDIAKATGFPDGKRAQAAVEKALESGIFTEDSQKVLRQFVSKRIERLTRSLWGKAVDPEHPDQMIAHQRLSVWIDQFVKLHGLAAPTQHVVTSPSAAALEAWVAEASKQNGPALEEPDIFELDSADYSETTDAVPAG